MFQALLASKLLGNVLKWLAIGTGVFLVIRYFSRKQDERNANKSDTKAPTDPAVGQAQLLRIAMNPSGTRSLFDVDGTNKTAILNVAREIKNPQAVIDAYKERYGGDSLLHHLEVELGPEDYAKFLALSGLATNSTTNYNVLKDGIAPKQVIRTTKETNARSSPKKTGVFDHTNVLALIPANYIIGFTTGKTEYDSDNDIIFLEVINYNLRKQQIKFWVAKSQVETFTQAEYEKRKKNGENFKYRSLDGLGSLPSPEVGTRRVTTLYNDEFKPVCRLRDRVRLGVPVMLLKNGPYWLIRFKDPEGVPRWVNAADVFLFQPTTP